MASWNNVYGWGEEKVLVRIPDQQHWTVYGWGKEKALVRIPYHRTGRSYANIQFNFMQWLIVYYQNQGKIQISLIPWLMYRSRNRGILFFSIKVYIILHAARVQVKFRAWLLATMTQSTVYPERFVCRWFVEMFDNSSRTISGRGY